MVLETSVKKLHKLKELYVLGGELDLPPCGVLGPWEEGDLHCSSTQRQLDSALAGLPQVFPAFVGLSPTIMLFEDI